MHAYMHRCIDAYAHTHIQTHTHTHTYTHTQMHMMFNFDLLLLLLKLCGMPPWFGDFLRLVSIGGASNWFGLVCPAHYGLSLPYPCAIFVAGFSLGSLLTFLVIGFYLWPWIFGIPSGHPASSQPLVSPSTRLAAYLYEGPVRPHRTDEDCNHCSSSWLRLTGLNTNLGILRNLFWPPLTMDWHHISSAASEPVPSPGDRLD